MEGVSLKEKAVFSGLLVLALYLFAAFLWFSSGRHKWAAKEQEYANLQRRVAAEDELCSKREEKEQEFTAEVLRIRQIDSAQVADTFWLDVIDDLATKNSITMPTKTPLREKEYGNSMKQITIKVEWIGSLESLVKFLYDLEATELGSFDVLDLDVNPYKRSPGFLTGQMTITCIFRRA